jgi:hypothetical protein
LRPIEASLGITGLALLLTAIVNAAQTSIDLFHAFCIFHLVGLAGISIRPRSFSVAMSRRQKLSVALFYFGYFAFLVFMIYIAVHAPEFGSDPECNSKVVFILFGVNIPATSLAFRLLLGLSMGSGMVSAIFQFLALQILDPRHTIWGRLVTCWSPVSTC